MRKPRYPHFFFFICLLISSLSFLHSKAQTLSVSGQKIVNTANGQEVILNAMNFGNWMVMEGYMMNSSSQATSQHLWKQKLTTLIGSTNTAAFYSAWLNNHVTQADINQLKTWGFNAVRLPLHYEYFVNLGTPDVWNPEGFKVLDSVLDWCKKAGMYAVIDLHATPGGQNNGDISDYDNTKPSLWESEANKAKTVSLWRKLSELYKNEPWIAGYDLINEPAWNLPGGTDLRNLYGRITDTIRATGDTHILFIEGNWYSNDYTGLTPAWDANMVYVFHKYWAGNTNADIQFALNMRSSQNRPIWCGEHGENSNHSFTELTELMNANGIGMSWWPMKKFNSISDFADAQFPAGYTNLLNYFGGTNPGLNPTTAFNTLMQLAENVKFSNCTINNEVLRAVLVQPGNRNTAPFAANNIPGRIYTTNYDQGMNGYAYNDQAWADFHVTTNINTAWNNGWTYRSNGVDIDATTDFLSNGYTVGWFTYGEWMKYTVNVASTGTYTIECRVANGSGVTGTLQIQNGAGTELLTTVSVPPTGGWNVWSTVSITGGFANTGAQAIRVVNAGGEFNINSVNFVYQNATVPAVVPIPPAMKVISLKGNNGLYVTFSGVDQLMTCNKSSLGTTEEFTIVDAGNGLVALKGSNGLYVTVNQFSNRMYCSATSIGTNEKFTMTDLSGAISLKGYNNLYVSSENGSVNGITCSRTSPAAWEYFNWSLVKYENIVTAVNDPILTSIAVYPNPAQNFIVLNGLTGVQNNITIYDINGRALIQTSTSAAMKTIDIAALPTGLFLVKISNGKKTTLKKLLKAQ